MELEVNEQISAEQILKEVYERRKVVKPSTEVDILDLEELNEYQRRKRTEYETYLKRNRLDIGQWMRYAQFEIEQRDIRRARSVFERALLINKIHIPLWIRYIDAELKLKYINHARNLLDRAITTLPRVDKLWYKYVLMEETLGHLDIVRDLFTKWISLEPASNAWDSFIDFEIRQLSWENVRQVYGKYVMVHPQSGTWLKWVNFESLYGDSNTTRRTYSLGIDTLVSFQNNIYDSDAIELVLSFANWEASKQEFARCRALYKISTERWPQNETIRNHMVDFEKKFGNIDSTEQSVIHRRRRRYEDKLATEPRNFDTWWLYLDLMKENFEHEMLHAFEKSVKESLPYDNGKTMAWRQYIYLWIRYLAYVELELLEISLCRSLYERLVNEFIPHKKFTFSKIWFMYAKFEIRQGNIGVARKILGKSIGMCPKRKTFKNYIEMEIKMKDFDRVRKLYEKFLEYQPTNLETWIRYAETEENLGDEARSRGIYEIALDNNFSHFSQESKAILMERYIEFESDAEEYGKARALFERYLKVSKNSPKVWVKYALYESSSPTEAQLNTLRESRLEQDVNSEDEQDEEFIEFQITHENKKNSRKIFERALEHFATCGDQENRIVILEAYKSYEEVYGGIAEQDAVLKRMPQIEMREKDDGTKENDYIFPEDNTQKPDASKFQALARKWNEEQGRHVK